MRGPRNSQGNISLSVFHGDTAIVTAGVRLLSRQQRSAKFWPRSDFLAGKDGRNETARINRKQ
jgi:hypothetical protein